MLPTTFLNARALGKMGAICIVRTDNYLCKSLLSPIELNGYFRIECVISLLPLTYNRECVIGDCNSVRHTDGNFDKTNNLELNQVLPYCLNSSIQRRFYPKCEVFKTGSCGYGLKVCVDVTCGTVMVEYTGEVITSSECSDRMRGMKGMTFLQ